MDDREIIKLVISMKAKTGATCVFGAYDLAQIIAVGCAQLGYDLLRDVDSEEIDTPKGKSYAQTIYAFITPRENHG